MPSFLSPLAALLGLLAIPIILLYILRQKRPDQPISSTLLWSKALADMRASTPWQKLRRNLLMFLQLLILAALVLTLMRPVIQAKAAQSTAGVIVLDATASMQATDSSDGRSRFDLAREEARKLIDAMRPGDRLNIIVDGGGSAQASTGFSGSKSELRGFLDGLKPADASSDLSESLLLAATSLRAIGGKSDNNSEALVAGKIYLLSDGAGISLPSVFKDLPLQFVKIGTSGNNVGITRLAITPVPRSPKTYQVFVGLLNAAPADREVAVGLALGAPDHFVDARKTTIPAGQTGSVTFEKVVSDPTRLFVQLDDKNDDLKVDNVAYGLIEPARKVRVTLVTAGNRPLEDFLRTAARLEQLDGEILSPARYKPNLADDLVIFDGVAPADYPRADVLLMRPPGSAGGFKVVGQLDHPGIFAVRDQDPVMAFIGDSLRAEVRISSALKLERDPEATELISAPDAPLMAYKEVGSSRRYFLAFSPLRESDWWSYPSFLMMLQNMVNQTRARHFIGIPQIIGAGTPARLWDVSPEATIVGPDGHSQSLAKYVRDSAAEFPETSRAGFYVVHSGEKTGTFAVNLLSPNETDMAPRSLATFAGNQVEEQTSIAVVNREIWPYLAVAALVLLLLEWWVYHRRIA